MKKRDLSDDEKELWKEFSKSTNPLPNQDQKTQETKPEKKKRINPVNLKDKEKYFAGDKKTFPHVDKAQALPVSSMDSKLHTKMRQGKIRPDAKLDLHGLNLSQAQPILTKFVLNAHGKGLRLVLIITGKGRSSEDYDVIPKRKGVLKATVPNWLAMEPLSSKILQITNAHVKHGGGGAFYVYLRKKRRV
jgi:DNA-nicking Smr family endonuclease